MWGSAFEVVTSHCQPGIGGVARDVRSLKQERPVGTCQGEAASRPANLEAHSKVSFQKSPLSATHMRCMCRGAGGEEGVCKVGRLPLGGYSIRGKRDCEASLPIRPFHNLPVGTARLRTRRFGNIFNFDEPSSTRPTTSFDELLPGFFIKRRTGGH